MQLSNVLAVLPVDDFPTAEAWYRLLSTGNPTAVRWPPARSGS
ncbi:hypothetical protein JD79_00600 [Geodermatophilus normandii]|uniref:Uncharacterized protein n=1 Tax=Geodermatophilus normandii TaxID=1137989 RepID=A0A317QCQ9_9ACTN|nr:hypothetical protein [Geodermatophilus normandii]PWW21468.1 hypothetical protein JD79_00600 [Geodermatophilus normandii]